MRRGGGAGRGGGRGRGRRDSGDGRARGLLRRLRLEAAALAAEADEYRDARDKDEEFSLMNYSEEFDIRPVADNPGLFKDMQTGAVLNMDNTAYKMYQQNKKRSEAVQRKQQETNEKVAKMDLEVEEMKGDLKELKGLIRDLIKGLNN